MLSIPSAWICQPAHTTVISPYLHSQALVLTACTVQGILQIDPENRWTPWQALQHPFITDQPFMGTFTPPQEPREFAPHAHHPPATQHNQRPTHNFPSSMQTGISAVSGQPAYVQVSPFAATHSPFAANHTGSSHMGDTLSQPFNNLDLRSTPRSSGFTGDRSGIPATVFPMVGPCVSQGPVRQPYLMQCSVSVFLSCSAHFACLHCRVILRSCRDQSQTHHQCHRHATC